MMSAYYLLVFDSTHAALTAERGLASHIPVRVMPTLRQISASCGISLRIGAEDGPTLEQLLREGAVPPGEYRLFLVDAGEVHELNKERQCEL